MRGRLLLISGVMALAILVLLLTILVGPSMVQEEPVTNEPVRPDQINRSFDLNQEITHDLKGGSIVAPVKKVDKGRWVSMDGGRRSVLTWHKLMPRPDGVMDVEAPTARIHFSPGRFLEIKADEGTFEAPGRDPRRGDFRGGVVVKFFEAEDGSRVDKLSDRDLQVRLDLEYAEFDRELGRIKSDGPVIMSGPRVDFKGHGLTLHYNSLRGRIDRLEVSKSEYLRLRSQAAPQQMDSPSDVDVSRARVRDGGQDRSAMAGHGDSVAQPAESPQYYRAELIGDVHIETEGRSVEMDADRLIAMFSLSSVHQRKRPRHALGATVPSISSDPLRSIWLQTLTACMGVVSPLRIEPASSQKKDVIVTWSGKLVMVPQAQVPELLSDPQDILLRLIGEPVHIRTDSQDTVIAAEVDFVTGSAAVRAASSVTQGMSVRSPSLGIITGRELFIDQTAGTGFVRGPGWLKSLAHDRTGIHQQAGGAIPADLEISWVGRVDLTFYSKHEVDIEAADSQEDDLLGVSRIAGLRSANFLGEVGVIHPQFGLSSNQLAIVLETPTSEDQVLRDIDATGEVVLSVRSRDPQEQVSIQARELNVQLEAAVEGDTIPNVLVAQGDVLAEQLDATLRCQHLEVAMGPAKPVGQHRTAPSPLQPKEHIVIKRLAASDQVLVELDEDQISIGADRLVGDVARDQLDLFGRPGESAWIRQDEGILFGSHFRLSNTNQTVEVPGSGRFEMKLGTADDRAKMAIVWAQSMQFDNLQGLAQFHGQVQATTHTDTDLNRLVCDRLQLFFEDDPDDVQSSSRHTQIRRAEALGHVAFDADQFAPGTQASPWARFHLEGHRMTFDQAIEHVRVVGAGRMLYQDVRPEELIVKADPAVISRAVRLSGRGETLFVWDGDLTFDVGQNDMIMQGPVLMVHRPAGGGEAIQLDCQNLLADLEEAGGLGAWMSDQAPQPQIALIRADHSVRIIRGLAEINCDHFQYMSDSDMVNLWANPGRMVEITDKHRSVPLRAEQFIWHLSSGNFEVVAPQGGVAPIRR